MNSTDSEPLSQPLINHPSTLPLPRLVPLGSSPRNQWQVGAAFCSLVRLSRPSQPVRLSAQPQNIELDIARTALIAIDLQNDFCHAQGWLASIGVDVTPARAPIAPLQRLLPALRQAEVPVVWLNWGNRPDRLNLSPSLLHVYNPDGRSTGLGGALPGTPCQPERSRVLQAASWGAEVVSELAQLPGDICIDKSRMSGFYDTALDAVLRNLGIQTLLFAGVNADQCVLATLMDANFLGYDCILLEDCAATTSPDFCWQATLYNVRQCFGFTAISTNLKIESIAAP